MSLRWTTLPPGLKQSIYFHLETSTFRAAPRNGLSSLRRTYASAQSAARFPTLSAQNIRRYWWLLPVGGGLALYLSPKQQSPTSALLTSPDVIPCQERESLPLVTTILSPAEPHILSHILAFFRDKIWEPILTARRFIHLMYLFLPVLISAPLLLVGAPEDRYGGDRWGAVWWYGYLTAQMERAGPTFVKLAQWAASRADLFPSMLCERLGSLHSRGKPHPIDHTKRVIERVFQRPFEEVFEEFDNVPMGSGAIAQVYRATLKKDLIPPSLLTPPSKHRSPVDLAATILQPPPAAPTGAVAVKILHPRVENLIRRDLKLMTFFADALTLIPGVQWLSLPEEVELFGQMMYEQLDLRVEGRNLTEFEKRFSGRNLPVTFPRPLEMWSTKNVLIEEYQNALSMEDFLRNGGGPYNDMLAEVGLDAFLNMLLLDNFVHSDLHPGNIMIKFVKPPSTTLLVTNALKALFKSKDNLTSAETNPSPQPDISTELAVNGLRSLKNDPPAWREALETLHAEGYTPEIVFIDAGLITTLNATDRRNFLDLFSAIAQFDGYRAGELMVERCRTPELALEPQTFALKMQHIVLNVKRKTFSLGQIMISDILQSVLKAVREHHVKLEADFVNTIISVLLLEGIGRQLDPGLDLFKSALPILRQLGRHMGTQENITQMEKGSLVSFFKVWLYVEARELASSALVDADELVKYDWLTPNI